MNAACAAAGTIGNSVGSAFGAVGGFIAGFFADEPTYYGLIMDTTSGEFMLDLAAQHQDEYPKKAKPHKPRSNRKWGEPARPVPRHTDPVYEHPFVWPEEDDDLTPTFVLAVRAMLATCLSCTMS